MHRAILLVAVLVGLGTLTASDACTAPAGGKVTLTVQKQWFRVAAEALFRPFGEEYRVGGEVDDVPVSFSVRNVTLDDGVRALVRAARDRIPDLTAYHWKGYVVKRRWAVSNFPNDTSSRVEVPGLEERVSLFLSGVPLRRALRYVTSQCSLQLIPEPRQNSVHPATLTEIIRPWIQVETQVDDVPVSVQATDVTPLQAILLIAGSANKSGIPLVLKMESENFILSLRNARPPSDQRANLEATVSLDLRRTPIREALQQICATAGGITRTELNVPELPITLRVESVAPEVAIRRVVAVAALQLPGLSIARGGDFFLIYRTDLIRSPPARNQISDSPLRR